VQGGPERLMAMAELPAQQSYREFAVFVDFAVKPAQN